MNKRARYAALLCAAGAIACSDSRTAGGSRGGDSDTPPPPLAPENDSAATNEETPIEVGADEGLLANDSGPPWTSIANVEGDTVAPFEPAIRGYLRVLSDGRFSFDPRGAFDHLTDSETETLNLAYDVSDGVITRTATFTIEVTGINDPPVAMQDVFAADVDTPLTVAVESGLLANDIDPEDDALAVASLEGDMSAPFEATGAGTLTVAADGSLTYDASAVLVLPGDTAEDTFAYTVSDGDETHTSSVTFRITSPNHAPVAQPDMVTVTEDEVLALATALLGNDTDRESDDAAALTISAVDASGTTGTVSGTSPGFSYDPTGAAAFQALQMGSSSADSFAYTIVDTRGAPSAPATVMVTITGVNDPPVAGDDIYETLGNTRLEVTRSGAGVPLVVVGSVLDNDTDVDNDDTSLTVTPLTSIDHSDLGGAVNMDAQGQFVYSPPAGVNDVQDHFTYTLNDPNGGMSTGHVYIDITSIVYYVEAGASGALLGNDFAPFDSLNSVPAIEDSTVFVFSGTGATPGDLSLAEGQTLTGQGVALVASVNSTMQSLQFAGTPPSLAGEITVGERATLRGFVLEGSSASLSGDGIDGLVISDVSVDIVATGGSGISLENGSGIDVAFDSVSVDGGDFGLYLRTLQGPVRVLGDGTGVPNGSGGLIQNTADTAVRVDFTDGLELSSMDFLNNPDHIIGGGGSVAGVHLSGLTIDGGNRGIGLFSLSGSNTIEEVYIQNVAQGEITVFNTRGNVDSLRILGGSIVGDAAEFFRHISLTFGSGVEAAIEVAGVNFADTALFAVRADSLSGSRVTLAVRDCTMTNLQGGLQLIANDGTLDVTVERNDMSNTSARGAFAGAYANGDLIARFHDNYVHDTNNGLIIQGASTRPTVVEFHGNRLENVGSYGLRAITGTSTALNHVSFIDNIIVPPAAGNSLAAVSIETSDSSRVCAKISGNAGGGTFPMGACPGSVGGDFLVKQLDSSLIQIEGTAFSATQEITNTNTALGTGIVGECGSPIVVPAPAGACLTPPAP